MLWILLTLAITIFVYHEANVTTYAEDNLIKSKKNLSSSIIEQSATVGKETTNVQKDQMKSCYRYDRSKYIFEKFDKTAEQYAFAWDYELLDYVETDTYTAIRNAVDIQAGTTTPSFFIGDDVIFCVFQDVDAVNHCVVFNESLDGAWNIGDILTQQDNAAYPSFSEYQADSKDK